MRVGIARQPTVQWDSRAGGNASGSPEQDAGCTVLILDCEVQYKVLWASWPVFNVEKAGLETLCCEQQIVEKHAEEFLKRQEKVAENRGYGKWSGILRRTTGAPRWGRASTPRTTSRTTTPSAATQESTSMEELKLSTFGRTRNAGQNSSLEFESSSRGFKLRSESLIRARRGEQGNWNSSIPERGTGRRRKRKALGSVGL